MKRMKHLTEYINLGKHLTHRTDPSAQYDMSLLHRKAFVQRKRTKTKKNRIGDRSRNKPNELDPHTLEDGL
jgi:hypothetical protein